MTTPVEENTAASQYDECVEELHSSCGVYTRSAVVKSILNQVKWAEDADLRRARLLEPAAGNGEFIIEAARRLVASYRARSGEPTVDDLGPRITAFEIHPGAVAEARRQVQRTLGSELGLGNTTARHCADVWINESDFLLADQPDEAYSHVVGNPPYIRWSKIPVLLRSKYEHQLDSRIARGDLFLPFLDRSLELLEASGKLGLLCSDRWRYMAFARDFRAKWLSRLEIVSHEPSAVHPFDRPVSAYPTILIASKLAAASRSPAFCRPGDSLRDLGCTIRVGPALGHTPAYVLKDDANDVEAELLHPWLSTREVQEDAIQWLGRHLIVLFDSEGALINLQEYPRLEQRLTRFRSSLKARAIVHNGAPWYRTIDRVRAVDWARTKILVPGIAKVPRVALDDSGAVPSNGLYAIFPPKGDVDAIYKRLRNGRLAAALDGIAPKVQNGYVRCYKHFLNQIRL